MIKRLLEFKRKITEAIELTTQNHLLLQQLRESEHRVEHLLHDFQEKSSESGHRIEHLLRDLQEKSSESDGRIEHLLRDLQEKSNESDGRIEHLLHDLQEKSNESGGRIEHLLRDLQEKSNERTNELEREIKQLELRLKLNHEIIAVNTAAFLEYKDAHTGRDVMIAAAGPSLKKYTQIKNAIHIGVNRVCTSKKIALDYYFLQDVGTQIPRNVPYEKEIVNLKCKKFFGLLACTPNGLMEPSESFSVKVNASRYFVDHSPSKYLFPDIRFHPLMDFCSVVFPALHFALFTNPKRIYLVGCDASHNGYFTDEKQKDSIEEKRHFLTIMIIGYRRLKEFAKIWYPETEIISINPVNLKGLFRDMYTDEQGILIEGMESPAMAGESDFSDEKIKERVDRHIEQVLLERVHEEMSCKECGSRGFSIMQGLSDDSPDKIKVECDACGFVFSFS